MAQTTTLRAQGAAFASDARFNRPCSSRASRYFISPACPSAIQRGKYSNSGASSTAAMPTSSKPASAAARVTAALISAAGSMVDGNIASMFFGLREKRQSPSDPQLFHFLVVVLAIEDIPL